MDIVSDLLVNSNSGASAQWSTWWWSSFALSSCLPSPLTLVLTLLVIVAYTLNQLQNGSAFNSKRNRGKLLLWWYRWTTSRTIFNDNNNHGNVHNINGIKPSTTANDVMSNNKTQNKFNSIYLLPDAPSPLSLPIIGHIYIMAKYPTNPWQGFNAIRAAYGDVVHLKLGIYQTVMVSSIEGMREVLLTKGDIFSNRPHFDRHALIFGRNRQNALALCDWSDNHKARRSIAHAAVIPRFGTNCFQRLTGCIENLVDKLLTNVAKSNNNYNEPEKPADIILQKSCLVKLCCEIFVEFLLEKKMDTDDPKFAEVCHRYDFIFYDINQMYLSDFLPFLKPIVSRSYLNKVEENANELADFIQKQIQPAYDKLVKSMKLGDDDRDSDQKTNNKKIAGKDNDTTVDYDEKSCQERFVDRILLHKQYNSRAQFLNFVLKHYLENQKTMTWDECLFEIGDLVGGNSAVANLLVRLLGFLVINPDVQEQLYAEAYSVATNNRITSLNGEQSTNKNIKITLEDRPYMPLTNAAIMETLRLASSPIVPHLARTDTSIQGYFIPKDTMILFNVYHLNLSPDYWHEPARFNPARFVTDDGNVVKPDYFFPFSHGRRSCLGYKMVNTIIFSTVANLLLHYRLEASDESNAKLTGELLQPLGSIALPYKDDECFNIKLVPRLNSQP